MSTDVVAIQPKDQLKKKVDQNPQYLLPITKNTALGPITHYKESYCDDRKQN